MTFHCHSEFHHLGNK